MATPTARDVPDRLPGARRRRSRWRLGEAAIFAILYGGVLAGLAALGLAAHQQALGTRGWVVVGAVLCGAAAGGLLAWTTAARLAGRRPASARFAAMLVLLTVGTAAGLAATLFVRLAAPVPWMHPERSALETVFSIVGIGLKAVYVTAAAGLPLLLPWGLLPLFAGAAAFALRTRRDADPGR